MYDIYSALCMTCASANAYFWFIVKVTLVEKVTVYAMKPCSILGVIKYLVHDGCNGIMIRICRVTASL